MARSNLQTAQDNWLKRGNAARQQGLPDASWVPLMQADMRSVAAGGTPMADQEVNVGVQSAAHSTPIIHPVDPHGASASGGGISGIVRNVPGDIRDIVQGFIPGTLHFLRHLPSEVSNVPGDLSKGWKGVENDPVLGLVPGLSDLATVMAGDKQKLEQHPVGALLDILPVGAVGGHAASEAGLLGEEAQRLAKIPHRSEKPTERTALAAFAQGQPIKALGRAGLDVASKAVHPFDRDANLREAFQRKLEQSVFSRTAQQTLRQWDTVRKKNQLKFDDFMDTTIKPLLGDRAHPDELTRIMKMLTLPVKDIPAEDRTLVYNLKKASNDFGYQLATEEGGVAITLPNGKIDFVDKSSPLVKSFQRKYDAERNVEDIQGRLPQGQTTTSALEKAKQQSARAQALYYHALKNQMTARYHPALHDAIQQGIHDYASTNPQKMTAALRDLISNDAPLDQLRQEMDATLPGEFDKIVLSARDGVFDLMKQGFYPAFIPRVSKSFVDQPLRIQPMTREGGLKPDILKQVFDMTPGATNAAWGLSKLALDHYNALAKNEFYDRFVKDHIKTEDDLLKEYYQETHDWDKARKLMEREWVSAEDLIPGARPTTHIGQRVKASEANIQQQMMSVKAAKRLLPKSMDTTVRSLLKNDWARSRNYDRLTRVFKLGVLTGPRYLVHVGIAGSLFGILERPIMLGHIGEAARMAKDPESWIPELMQSPIENYTTDQILNYSSGHSLGRIAAAIPEFQGKFVERMVNIQRHATFLAAKKSGKEDQAAIDEALRTYVDLSTMSPVERSIINQVFPFYAYTRHLFRYMFRYPADHPLRTMMLSQFAENYQKDWNSGIPQKFQQMFMLGTPDKNGNIKTVDYRNINPFRSFYSDFTLAGFLSGLNPTLQLPFQIAGVNTLSGVGSLYPQVEYDPVYGNLQASNKLDLPGIIEAYVPELQGLDAFVGFSDKMRTLKRSNPTAYRSVLLNALNIPFAGTNTYNIDYVQAKNEMNIYRAAQAALSGAKKTQDFQALGQQYNLVPEAGGLVDPKQIANYYAAIDQYLKSQGQQGINPAAVAPKATSRRSAPLSVRVTG